MMNAGVDRPLDHRQSRSINAPRCCRNLQSPVANRPLTARAIFFLISTSILRPSLRSSCPGDNGPFVAANETFVIAVLGRLQPAIELGEMPRQNSADCERCLAPVQTVTSSNSSPRVAAWAISSHSTLSRLTFCRTVLNASRNSSGRSMCESGHLLPRRSAGTHT